MLILSITPTTLKLPVYILIPKARYHNGRTPHPATPRCRHCKQRTMARRCGLCIPCFRVPGIRALYPTPERPCQRRGVGFAKGTELPPSPTDALPGSPEKVAVLEWRVAHGYRLWHPDDSRVAETDVA